MIDVSPLVPEAQQAALAAAAVYVRHTTPWLVGLTCTGSALKGGYIPGCSDIDLHLYLTDSAFERDRRIPLELGLVVHRDLAKIDPAPFRYIQCHALKTWLTGEDELSSMGPVPGAYHVLLGNLPVPEATPEQVRDRATRDLDGLRTPPFDIAGNLLDRGGGRFESDVRLLCTKVWPALYEVLTLEAEDPLRPWGLPKDEAIRLLPDATPLGHEIRRSHQAVREYYPGEHSVDAGLRVIETGIAFLQAAKDWYDQHIRRELES